MQVFRGERVVFPDGERPASLHIQNARIAAICDPSDIPAGADVVDAGPLVLSPGLVDTHVHLNEPGRAEWEGVKSGTRAAVSGGIVTIVDMPLNSIPPSTSVEALDIKRVAGRRKCWNAVYSFGGIVPGNEADIQPMLDTMIRGFKCFLVPSGVDEFPPVDEPLLRRVMPILARRDAVLLVHAELPQFLRPHHGSVASYRDYEATRPPEAEARAIEMMAMLSRDTGARVHIVHVSSAAGVEALAAAQAQGIRITGETCPHYLTFADDEIPDGATEFKCAPPIRTPQDRDALWGGLQNGTLSLIVTDHSPSPPELKTPGNFVTAWGGIASLELSLPVVWTEASRRGFTRVDLARWMSAEPAKLAQIPNTGQIAIGHEANFVIWDPDATFTVVPERLQQRHKLTPYAGRTLRGIVHETYWIGQRMWPGDGTWTRR